MCTHAVSISCFMLKTHNNRHQIWFYFGHTNLDRAVSSDTHWLPGKVVTPEPGLEAGAVTVTGAGPATEPELALLSFSSAPAPTTQQVRMSPSDSC